ncbi:serine hydrolase domain-containing protein [Bradyrhizobium mercantei]|uniref:serine hydrolase domain-containing protein n=1 Tax=Bradyrhizobium mercantei TaxID=1904807 RepID=UPI001FD9E75F|nr:serine hydrolase domain-containing protein [Bradyrhizobium mercantei]
MTLSGPLSRLLPLEPAGRTVTTHRAREISIIGCDRNGLTVLLDENFETCDTIAYPLSCEKVAMSITRRKILQSSLLCAAGMVYGSAPALAQEPALSPTPDERKRLARLAAAFMETYEVPGLSVAIAIKGKPAYVEAFGVADREAGEALMPQHRFRMASISKPITSTGIFTLIEAGKLQLDSHVFGPNSILGHDYPTPPDRSVIEQITIEHLLTHTTGGWGNDSNDPMFLNQEMHHRELIAWTLNHMPLTDPVGKSFAYSNFGYCLLGRVIEKLTNQTYEQYIKDNILKRCGITDMEIAGNTLEDRATNEVKYYDQNPGDPYGMNVARMDSHGGWIATPSDLTMFFNHIDGFKDTDQLLKDDTLRTMTTPSAANPRYAKGLFVNPQNNWWHDGSLPGTATISVRTHSDFCWSAFTNTRSKFGDMGSALDRLPWHMVASVADWASMAK